MRTTTGMRSTAFSTELATGSNDAGLRELRDSLILAVARGMRRSGGRLQADGASRNPGARLVAELVDETQEGRSR